MKKTDPRYPEYLVYQRDYQRNRRNTDPELRIKRNWDRTKSTHKKKEKQKMAASV